MRYCSIEGCDNKHDSHGYCGKHAASYRRYGDPLYIKTTPRNAATEFVIRAAHSDTDECIIFPYSKNCYGYGQATWNGKQRGAHRISLIIASGPPPFEGAQAAHDPEKCTDRACVNPRHLRWASPAENSEDRWISETVVKGEDVYTSKLTEQDVLDILASTETQCALAKKYGISQSAVHKIKARKMWAWM